jgi:hypothetical protein
LSQGQQSEVAELKKTDAAVRKHEQAHLSAAGGYARSGIVLNFKTGPDGKQYAVGGHVDIDTSVVKGNPAATIAKMETVQKAALAPADPSAQDVHVAAMASQQAGQARAQEAQQQQAAASGATGSGTAASGTGASGTGASGTGASGTGASGTGAAASSATASSSPTTQKAGAGLKLSIAARYSSSSYRQPSKAAAGSSSTLGPSLDLVG